VKFSSKTWHLNSESVSFDPKWGQEKVYRLLTRYWSELQICKILYVMRNATSWLCVIRVVKEFYRQKLRWSVHFDIFALFSYFSLDKKLFATLKFSYKNFLERKLTLLCFFCLICFFQIIFFYFINRPLKNTQKTGDLAWRRQNWGTIIFFYFFFIKHQKKRSRPPNQFICNGLILFLRQNRPFVHSIIIFACNQAPETLSRGGRQ
jgi:hypothetical protein